MDLVPSGLEHNKFTYICVCLSISYSLSQKVPCIHFPIFLGSYHHWDLLLHHSLTLPLSSIAKLFLRRSKGGGGHGCVACTLKCSTKCPFALYIPQNQSEQFLNAHKVFSHGRSPRILLQTLGALHNPRQRRKKEEVCINNFCKCCFILKKKLMNLKSMMDLNMSWVLPLLSQL